MRIAEIALIPKKAPGATFEQINYKITEVSRINPNLLLKLIFTKTFKY
jgi:hypothetical protein